VGLDMRAKDLNDSVVVRLHRLGDLGVRGVQGPAVDGGGIDAPHSAAPSADAVAAVEVARPGGGDDMCAGGWHAATVCAGVERGDGPVGRLSPAHQVAAGGLLGINVGVRGWE